MGAGAGLRGAGGLMAVGMMRQANDGTGSHPDLGAQVVPSVVAPARDGPPRIGPAPHIAGSVTADTGPALSPIASRTSSQPSVVSSSHPRRKDATTLRAAPGGYGPKEEPASARNASR